MPSAPTPPPSPSPPLQLGALSGIEPDGDIAATELGGLRLDDYARALARLNRAEVEPQDPSGALDPKGRQVLASVGLDEARWRQGAALWRAELTTDVERDAPRYAETFAILYRHEETFGGDIASVDETAPVAHIALTAEDLQRFALPFEAADPSAPPPAPPESLAGDALLASGQTAPIAGVGAEVAAAAKQLLRGGGDGAAPAVDATMASPIPLPAVEAMSVERYAELTHREQRASTPAERRRVFDVFSLQDEVHRARLGREMKRLFADKPELQRRFDQALDRLSSDR